ncbi:MAG: hypothetical protein KKA19_04215 [Candidatus Margulisbacteria bacterium]|nr:hypothetical protein [Candidatus Margulisiibacteriota bacterium]
MRKSTVDDLIKGFDNIDLSIIDKKLFEAFKQLKKELNISKEINITDSIYLQPFKIEYVEVSGGLKGYFYGIEKQQEEKKDKYVKLCIMKGGKLVVIKSFGKVSNLKQETLNKLLLLIRLAQYFSKGREIYSLEIAIKQLLKPL